MKELIDSVNLPDRNRIDFRYKRAKEFREKLRKNPVQRVPDFLCAVISIKHRDLVALIHNPNRN